MFYQVIRFIYFDYTNYTRFQLYASLMIFGNLNYALVETLLIKDLETMVITVYQNRIFA